MVFIPGTHFPNLFLPNQNPTSGKEIRDAKKEKQEVSFPPFSALPLHKDGPRGNAWGLYPFPSSSATLSQQPSSSSSSKDQLGSLNLLTPQTTLNAAKEIVHGVRICTDWELTKPRHACFGRRKFDHRIVNKSPRTVNDDVVEMNTQSGSQWDGFRHFGRCAFVLWKFEETAEEEG